ncbi:hypothetical protein C0993_010727 [Termitomyces sp. T159_Od127]|nr:hypothetical protein C0993_010727 [Termitomyces sp. T159_Od127]
MLSSRSTRSTALRNNSESSPTTHSGESASQNVPAPSLDAPPDSQNLHSDCILPNAGIPGPIPEDFDFDGRISLPDGITRFELPLAVRIRENVNIEEFNNTSILKTIAAKNTPIPRPNDLDIGPPFKPLYYYADDEVRDLMDSEALLLEYRSVTLSKQAGSQSRFSEYNLSDMS